MPAISRSNTRKPFRTASAPFIDGLPIDHSQAAVRSIVRPANGAVGTCQIDTARPWDLYEEIPPGTEMWIRETPKRNSRILFHGWVAAYEINVDADQQRDTYSFTLLDAAFRAGDNAIWWNARNRNGAQVIRIIYDGANLPNIFGGAPIPVISPKIDKSLLVIGDSISEVGDILERRSWTFGSRMDAWGAIQQVLNSYENAIYWIEPAQRSGQPDIMRIKDRRSGSSRRLYVGDCEPINRSKATIANVQGRVGYDSVRNATTGYGDVRIWQRTDQDPSGNDLTLVPLWDQDDALNTEFLTVEMNGNNITKTPYERAIEDPRFQWHGRIFGIPKAIARGAFARALAKEAVETYSGATSESRDLFDNNIIVWARAPNLAAPATEEDKDWHVSESGWRIVRIYDGPQRKNIRRRTLAERINRKVNLSEFADDVSSMDESISQFRVLFQSPQLYNREAVATQVLDVEETGTPITVFNTPVFDYAQFQMTMGVKEKDPREKNNNGRLAFKGGFKGDDTLPWERNQIVELQNYHFEDREGFLVSRNFGEKPARRAIAEVLTDLDLLRNQTKRIGDRDGEAVRGLSFELDGIDPFWFPGTVLKRIENSEISPKDFICVSVQLFFGGDISSGTGGVSRTLLEFDNITRLHS
jgi:hypothetical protein